jgi:cysteine desulfuration protein SufE
MTINEIQDEIIEEFAFDDWADKYEYIIDMGKKLKGLPKIKKQKIILSKVVKVRCGLMPTKKETI